MFKATKKYDDKFLEPFISEETQNYHFGKHHVGYANTLNSLIEGTDLEKLSLVEIIQRKNEIDKKIYNNASQLFNHDFYWSSITSKKTEPSDNILKLIEKSFKSFREFQSSYINKASEIFGSGWSWVVSSESSLSIINTQNSDTPTKNNLRPVLVIDLWEHAYYIDYKNDRKTYIETIVQKCLNWDFAEGNVQTSS